MNLHDLGWAHVASVLLGGMIVIFLKWVAKWLDGHGVEFVKAELEKLRSKANENSLLGQILADAAVVEILEKTLPSVVHLLSDEIKVALTAGNLDNIPWEDIGKKVWAAAEPQITGGVNDYLKASSFNQDGATLAAAVAKRFFVAQKLVKDGVVVPKA